MPFGLDERTWSSLLWGVIGGLSFLVLAQAFNLLAGTITADVMVVVALAVALLTAAASALTRGRLENERA